ERRLFPHQLDVGGPAHHEDDIHRTGAHCLVRDVNTVCGLRVTALGNVHARILPRTGPLRNRAPPRRSEKAVTPTEVMFLRPDDVFVEGGEYIGEPYPCQTSPAGVDVGNVIVVGLGAYCDLVTEDEYREGLVRDGWP